MEIRVNQEIREMSDEDLKVVYQIYIAQYDRVARRALLALYDRQTEEERRYPDQAHQSNGAGFSEQDQSFLSSIARAALRGAEITPKQYEWMKKLLPKYAGQLVKITRYNQRKEDQGQPRVNKPFGPEDETAENGFISLKRAEPPRSPDELTNYPISADAGHPFDIGDK